MKHKLKIVALALTAVGAAAALLRPRAASPTQFSTGFPRAALQSLGANPAAVQVGEWAWDEWTRAGLDPRAKIALLAIGWHETRLQPLRSAAGLRDDQGGGSWGPWQVMSTTARALGRPTGPATLGTDEASIRDQARTALAFAGYAGLLRRALARGDVGGVTGELATSWGAGHGRDLEWVLNSPLNVTLNGRYDSSTLRAALAAGTLGPVGALVARRILTARQLAGEELAA